MPLLSGYKIDIHVPCQRMPLQPLNWADVTQCAPALVDIVAYLAQAHPFARLGNYDGNFEVSVGFEGFTPRSGANPRHGQLQEKSVLPSLTLTTYVTERVGPDKIDHFIEAIRQRHPWEHPVIVICEAQIFVPDNAI